MDIIFQIFDLIFKQPITNILLGFYQLLSSVGLPFALGFSIILLTIFLRIVLYPFMSTQIRSSKKMQELAPEMKSIREKHKDRQKQQEMMMRLYKKHNINPAAGCLPAIIQLPIIFALYQVITQMVSIGSFEIFSEKVTPLLYFDFLKPDHLWDTKFFGIELAVKPIDLLNQGAFLIILIPLLTAASQMILSKMMMNKVATPKTDKPDDFQTTFMKQSLFIFPIMIGFFSFTLPTGLSLYWITFTLFGILQQYLLVGFGGLVQWIPQLANYERYTK